MKTRVSFNSRRDMQYTHDNLRTTYFARERGNGDERGAAYAQDRGDRFL